MRQTIKVLMTVLGLGVGIAVAASPANAATAVPWDFVKVQVSGVTNPNSLYVPLTANCPAGFTPVSGGISGPGSFYVINEYATYPDESFSEQILALVVGTWKLTVDCARADQVGAIQVVSADFGRNSSGQAGGWVACPNGTQVIGGGEDWNLAGARDVQYAAPSDDGASWYATGHSDVGGNSLHVEAYCVASGELTTAQRVTQSFLNPVGGGEMLARCPGGTLTLTGGVYAALAGSGVDPGQFAGYVQDSYPDALRQFWIATVPYALPPGTTVYVTAWCVPASTPTVVITSAPPAQTAQTAAHFSFLAADPAGYQLTYTCILDGTASGCDSTTGTGYDPLGEGRHTFDVSVSNADGNVATAGYTWTIDTTAPTVTATAPALSVTLASSTTVSWTGQDNAAGTGISYYQVRERKAAYSAGFTIWTYPSGWQTLSPATTSVSASLAEGWDYCFSVRAVDWVGNLSAWTTPSCIARPLDDRALSVSAGWVRGTGASYWNGTITGTTTRAATAARTGAELDRVGILATRGPGMGTVAIYVGTTRIGEISLAASVTHYRDLIVLPPFSYRTGTVSVKVISRGKPVQVDGLVISRS